MGTTRRKQQATRSHVIKCDEQKQCLRTFFNVLYDGVEMFVNELPVLSNLVIRSAKEQGMR